MQPPGGRQQHDWPTGAAQWTQTLPAALPAPLQPPPGRRRCQLPRRRRRRRRGGVTKAGEEEAQQEQPQQAGYLPSSGPGQVADGCKAVACVAARARASSPARALAGAAAAAAAAAVREIERRRAEAAAAAARSGSARGGGARGRQRQRRPLCASRGAAGKERVEETLLDLAGGFCLQRSARRVGLRGRPATCVWAAWVPPHAGRLARP